MDTLFQIMIESCKFSKGPIYFTVLVINLIGYLIDNSFLVSFLLFPKKNHFNHWNNVVKNHIRFDNNLSLLIVKYSIRGYIFILFFIRLFLFLNNSSENLSFLCIIWSVDWWGNNINENKNCSSYWNISANMIKIFE